MRALLYLVLIFVLGPFVEGFVNGPPASQVCWPPTPATTMSAIRLFSSPRDEGTPDSLAQEMAIALSSNETVDGADDSRIMIIDASTPAASIATEFREKPFVLLNAAFIGLFTGGMISVFKLSVEELRRFILSLPLVENSITWAVIPVLGGLAVGLLLQFGGKLPPGLKGTIDELDEDSILMATASQAKQNTKVSYNGARGAEINDPPGSLGRFQYDITRDSRKALGAILTLGSGNSLGPEGPSVENGLAVSRLITSLPIPKWMFGDYNAVGATKVAARNRLLMSCGAAAGVAAGFNAPLSGVWFVLEIVQKSLPPLPESSQDGVVVYGQKEQALASQSINISAILLSSVISALVAKNLLGDELALRLPPNINLQNALFELPLYLTLGVCAGIVATLFSGLAQNSKSLFEGSLGPNQVREAFQTIPNSAKPAIASLVCGGIATFYPQVLFFGYGFLNTLLSLEAYPTDKLFELLGAKMVATAVAVASGLVGGTFAPALFMGGMLGAGFHNLAASGVDLVGQALTAADITDVAQPYLLVSSMRAYAVVGAAGVLAALFRAPLTASLLLFEVTRQYDMILPLMATAGVASLVGDVVTQALKEMEPETDNVSWGDLAMPAATDDEKNKDSAVIELALQEREVENVR